MSDADSISFLRGMIDECSNAIDVLSEDVEAIDGKDNEDSALQRIERSIAALATRLSDLEKRVNDHWDRARPYGEL